VPLALANSRVSKKPSVCGLYSNQYHLTHFFFSSARPPPPTSPFFFSFFFILIKVVEAPPFNQKKFLNDMETYLNRNGGTAPFARLSLIKNVHRPLDELCALCNSDPRFKFSTYNPKKILEISLTAEAQVYFCVCRKVQQHNYELSVHTISYSDRSSSSTFFFLF
jgi:hypothetical protein